MIGGASVKEWEINFQKKKIPEYLINDPKFISALFKNSLRRSLSELKVFEPFEPKEVKLYPCYL